MSVRTKRQLESLDSKTQTFINELLDSNSTRQQFFQRFDQLDDTQRSLFEKLGLENIQRNKQIQCLDFNFQRIFELLAERRSNYDTEVAESRRLLEKAREAAAKLVDRDNLKRADRARRVKVSILDSLRFADMNHRPEGISSPHEATFRWVFEDSKRYQKPWDNLSEWLSECSGIYWIQGKPASGKSTLMRFIVNHPATPVLLKRWTGQAELLLGAFYFWNSGSPDQRSHAGLLRTLLYEVLSKREDLILEIFRAEWEWKRDTDLGNLEDTREQWSLGRLQRAFKSVVELANRSLKICFFIDGLDEYEGEPGDIAEFVYELAELSPYTKFCVSGRPLSVFQSVLLKVPGLKLQDLTQDDIKNYVNQKLGSDRHMRWLLQKNPGDGNWLIAEIVQRANGVFLWVILVVRSLIHGFRSGDRMQHLRQRLNALPVDLETLFGHIMERIEPEYQEESSMIFQIFQRSNHVLDLFTLQCALLHPTHQSAIEMPVTPASELVSSHIDTDCFDADLMRLRLGSRCRGLLETSSEVDNSSDRQELAATPSDALGISRVGQLSQDTKEAAQPRSRQNAIATTRNTRSDAPPTRFATLTTLPWNAQQLMDNINGPACRNFVFSQMTAKYYLRCGHSNHTSQLSLNNPYNFEDWLYLNAIWLSQEYGGEILEWIHMTLVLRQDYTGFPRLGLLTEWDEAKRKLSKNTAEAPVPLPLEDPDVPKSQDPAPAVSLPQETGLVTEEQKCSNQSQGVYWISYLHRTARDFLEKPKNWSRITRPTLKSGFDPSVAILMASLVKLKTQPTTNVYETGVTFLKMIKYLNMTPSDPLIEVMEEYDRVLNVRWEEHGGTPHWSRGDPEWKWPRPDWGDDFGSIAIQLGLTWIITTRETHHASPIHRARQAKLPLPFFNMVKRPGLPLIAYTIQFHNWALWECDNSLAHPTLDVKTLNQLLDQGFDPNECFQGYTVWEYTLYQVHTHKDLLFQESKLDCWLNVFKVMLIHGADPYACCLHDPGEFNKGICLVDKSSPESEKRAKEHLLPDSRAPTKRGFDASAWDMEDTHPYHHSVTAIVADVFSLYNCSGATELQEILEARKKQTFRSPRKRKTGNGRQDDLGSSNWVS
jgi:hypothetical protein